MTTTAQISAKGCQNTGLTEDHAKRLHDNLGRTIVAIVELTADSRTENCAGDEKVKLNIGTIEVAPDGEAAEHLRELARLFHYERQLADGQPTLPNGDYGQDGPEPTVAQVLAAGARFKPHPFLPVDAADDNGICDVCGQLQDAAPHAEHDSIPDPFTVPDDDSQDDDEDGDEADQADQAELGYEPDPTPAA